jgi:hypothetical protein
MQCEHTSIGSGCSGGSCTIEFSNVRQVGLNQRIFLADGPHDSIFGVPYHSCTHVRTRAPCTYLLSNAYMHVASTSYLNVHYSGREGACVQTRT